MNQDEIRAGDYVKYDIVVNGSTVQGQGQVTAVTKNGPMIKPFGGLPRGAILENIEKVAR